MKTVILAGGLGTRLSEETATRPKPMVEIGGRPILWHIMNLYARHGFREFIVACGYKGDTIKEYFSNFAVHNSDLRIDLKTGTTEILNSAVPDWSITLVDTGLETLTGGRLRRLKPWLAGQTFMLTYGDGLADINLQDLVAFHRKQGKLATVTAVPPLPRFGSLELNEDKVSRFSEKPRHSEDWINGGFFVLEPAVIDYIDGDTTPMEGAPLERLAANGQLAAYRHTGFWHAMDSLRDKNYLEGLWREGRAPWKTWA